MPGSDETTNGLHTKGEEDAGARSDGGTWNKRKQRKKESREEKMRGHG
jgi:hypothetical protein